MKACSKSSTERRKKSRLGGNDAAFGPGRKKRAVARDEGLLGPGGALAAAALAYPLPEDLLRVADDPEPQGEPWPAVRCRRRRRRWNR